MVTVLNNATGMGIAKHIAVGRTYVWKTMKNARILHHKEAYMSNAFSPLNVSLGAAAPLASICAMTSHSVRIQLEKCS